MMINRLMTWWAVAVAIGAYAGCGASSGTADPSPIVPIDASATGDAGGEGGLGDSGKAADSGPVTSGDGGESVGLVTNCTIPTQKNTGVEIATNVTYATMDGQAQKLDIAWPSSGGPHPLLVMIHGGGWWTGDKGAFETAIQIMAGQGYVAATLNYRLADSGCVDGGAPSDGGLCHPNHFPAAVEDVRCAVRWLKANAATYSIDPMRVASLGTSAGGHLASMLGSAATVAGLDGPCPVNGDPSVSAAVSYFGPEDLFHWDPTFSSAQRVSTFLGTPTFNSNQALAELASPIDHVTPQTPPFLMLHGTVDGTVPYEQSVSMRAALQTAGVPATLVTLPNVGHGFPWLSAQAPYLTTSCTMLAFLEKYLKP